MAKDLRPFTLKEFQLDGVFYRKEPDGSFSNCSVSATEVKTEQRKAKLSEELKEGIEKGIYFIRLNKPWCAFGL